MKKSIPVSELRFGMYVAELDRPWTETPFRFQGFVLSNEQQLETLKKYCKTVIVDSERSVAVVRSIRDVRPAMVVFSTLDALLQFRIGDDAREQLERATHFLGIDRVLTSQH